MNSVELQVEGRSPAVGEARAKLQSPEVRFEDPRTTKSAVSRNWAALLSVPVAALMALIVHAVAAKGVVSAQSTSYNYLLIGIIAAGLAAFGLQFAWAGLRRWIEEVCPIIAAAIVLVACWDIITTGLRWLPMPYFPGPAGVLQSLIDDRKVLLECTANSLFLLLAGYAIGGMVGLVFGVCIGWFQRARYWGMPLLKVLGPIPATAWVPLAMVISPSGRASAIGLIALAVWFPVAMLTVSGIANTKSSYLDVARTLGAKPAYLIFRVAIPAATPSIFLGLFMGLGASFLTLIVAETVGVKSGLGWYVGWAQGWAEYGKVYAALVIMAAFFSTIMTLLFKLRDRLLVWQKGVIKW